MRTVSVMFVCLGNICRSPLAEAIFRQKVTAMNLAQHFNIESSGTSNYHIGENADPRTIATARDLGVPINHRAQQLNKQHLKQFDYILVMDDSNLSNVLKLGEPSSKTTLRKMRFYDTEEPMADVPDPWFGGIDGFGQVHEIIERSVEGLLDELITKYELK